MITRWLGRRDYEPVFAQMLEFTEKRSEDTEDEIWILEHNPVYTLGKSGKMEHLLNADTGIPLVKTDRGGQITYHGPGQLVAYTLVNFKRLGVTVHEYVVDVASCVIKTLDEVGISSSYDDGRPGVYVGEKKISSLGFRIHKNSVYHGIALNVDMDLQPFRAINPCGYSGLEMTSVKLENPKAPSFDEIAKIFEKILRRELQGLADPELHGQGS